MIDYCYSRMGKEFSNESKFIIFDEWNNNESLKQSSEKDINNNKDEYKDKLPSHNYINGKVVSVQQNDSKEKKKVDILNELDELNEKTTKKSTQEIENINPIKKIFKINKMKKVRKFEMRTQYLINFFKYLQYFITFLMKKFNKSRENEEDKTLPIFEHQASKIFIKYDSKEAYNSFCLNKTAREILSIKDKENKNQKNINTINKVMNAEGKKRNEELIEVLNKPIKQLMDIYRDKNAHKDDFYKDFTRFEDYLNMLRQEKDPDMKKIKIIEQQGLNYEAILKYNVDNECKHGPKPKK